MPLKTDQEGYLICPKSWQPVFAQTTAQTEQLHLTAEHFALINSLRQFYFTYHRLPSNRILMKLITESINNDCANNIYFHQLFPQGLKQALKIAGLPKPTSCV